MGSWAGFNGFLPSVLGFRLVHWPCTNSTGKPRRPRCSGDAVLNRPGIAKNDNRNLTPKAGGHRSYGPLLKKTMRLQQC